MNESPSPHDLSAYCVRYLKYALAGDFESTEILDQLLARVDAIQWDDPAFIALTKDVRGEAQGSPFSNDLEPLLPAMTYALIEKLAAKNEEDTSALAMVEQLKDGALKYHAQVEITNNHLARALKFIEEAIEVHIQMRAQLELLGADTSIYELPKLS